MDASLAGLVRGGNITMATAEARSSTRRSRASSSTSAPIGVRPAEWRPTATFAFKAVDLAGPPQTCSLDGVQPARR